MREAVYERPRILTTLLSTASKGQHSKFHVRKNESTSDSGEALFEAVGGEDSVSGKTSTR